MGKNIREVQVKGLTFDPITNVPIVLLRDLEDNRMLPIWIGVFEANAIALEIEKIVTPRPMTHDLMKNIFETVSARIDRVVVDNLQENTFYASIYLDFNGKELKIDSRPSDAIALALRARIPIFVTSDVLLRAQSIEIEESLGDKESWKKWLDNIKPEDFSKFQ